MPKKKSDIQQFPQDPLNLIGAKFQFSSKIDKACVRGTVLSCSEIPLPSGELLIALNVTKGSYHGTRFAELHCDSTGWFIKPPPEAYGTVPEECRGLLNVFV